MRSRRLGLFVLPFLLLIPLGFVKWRADHPLPSATDRKLEATFNQVPWVYVCGVGGSWQTLTGVSEKQGILITDKSILREVTQTLRLGEVEAPLTTHHSPLLYVSFLFPATDLKPHHFSPTSLFYLRTEENTFFAAQSLTHSRDNIAALKEWGGDWALDVGSVSVRPQSATQFEALIARLAQHAKAPGKHPAIELRQWGSY